MLTKSVYSLIHSLTLSHTHTYRDINEIFPLLRNHLQQATKVSFHHRCRRRRRRRRFYCTQLGLAYTEKQTQTRHANKNSSLQ
jgi:hypothetical protein